MSVAIIVDTFPRWSERFIARELNEILRRGIEFKIYCLRAGDSDCDADPEFKNLLPHRIVLPSCFLPTFVRNVGADAAAKERLKLVEDALGATAFRQIGCADSLTKIIREHGHKIVYAHFASLPSTLGWLAAGALKLPFVMSCHARDVFVDAQVSLLAAKVQSARSVFTCNRKAEAYAKSILSDDESNVQKIDYMPHGLPFEHYPFSPRHERSPNGKKLRLLAAGRFVPKKGFNDLIDALARPDLDDAAIELTILGEGPERKRFVKQIERLGAGARISMPGVADAAEMTRQFESADAFVVPSIEIEGDSDGLPNVVLEAFAYGVPVIGTNAGSLTDVLNASTGFVVERVPSYSGGSRFTRDLALAIRKVLMEPEMASEKALRARDVIENHFDIRKNIEPLILALTSP